MDSWTETLKRQAEEMRVSLKVIERGSLRITGSVAGGRIEDVTDRYMDDLKRWIGELEKIIQGREARDK